jgi:type VI secretion system protein ImpK
MIRGAADDLDYEPSAPRSKRATRTIARRATVSADLGTVQQVHEAVRPVVSTPLQMMQMKRERRPPPELAHQQLRKLLDQTSKQLEALDLTDETVVSIRYALVAYVDEVMQSEPGPIKDFWRQHLWQLELFGETRAGEGFFDRVQQLQRAEELVPLHVYYVLLLLGFHGIYSQHGELERENLIQSVRETLVLGGVVAKKPELAPNGARPREPGIDRARNRLLQWLAVASAFVATVWYFGLLFTVDAQASNLTKQINDQTSALVPDSLPAR